MVKDLKVSFQNLAFSKKKTPHQPRGKVLAYDLGICPLKKKKFCSGLFCLKDKKLVVENLTNGSILAGISEASR